MGALAYGWKMPGAEWQHKAYGEALANFLADFDRVLGETVEDKQSIKYQQRDAKSHDLSLHKIPQ